jgi:DNA-binding transcriptional LysR family regulator
MCLDVEFSDMHAVVVLAEESNVARAADRMQLTEPALSQLITDVEEKLRVPLFMCDKGRGVTLTNAGRVFVEEARTAPQLLERAFQLAHAAQGEIQ